MTFRSNPDWLAELIAREGDTRLIAAEDRDALVAAITAAARPAPIDPQRHEQLLAAALGNPAAGADDPLAPPTAEESASLSATNLQNDPILAALRAASAPQSLSPDRERAIRSAALGSIPLPRRERPKIVASIWGALAVAALAVVWVATETRTDGGTFSSHPHAQIKFAPSRSTGSLFAEPFGNTTASQRIDRIAQVRHRELRENRYLMWGLP